MANAQIILFPGTGSNLVVADNSTMCFVYGCTHDTINATGKGDFIGLNFGASDITVNDHSQGLTLSLIGVGAHITVNDWAHDKTAQISMGRDFQAPKLASDGHGGTLLTAASGGGTVDFTHAHVTMAQIHLMPH